MGKLLLAVVLILVGAMCYGLAGCGDPYGLDGYTTCGPLRAKQAAVFSTNPDPDLLDAIEARLDELGC